jgi:hypothetical protein
VLGATRPQPVSVTVRLGMVAAPLPVVGAVSQPS